MPPEALQEVIFDDFWLIFVDLLVILLRLLGDIAIFLVLAGLRPPQKRSR